MNITPWKLYQQCFDKIKTYVHSFAVVISSTSQLSTGAPGSSTSVQYCFLISCFASLQWFVKIFNLYILICWPLPLLIWNIINLKSNTYINAAIISWTSASSPNIVTFTNIHIGFLQFRITLLRKRRYIYIYHFQIILID